MKAYTRLFSAFGTLNRILVYLNENVAEPPSVLDSIEQRFSEMDDKLSVFKMDSEVSRINAAAGTQYVTVSADTLEIISLAKQYSMMTHGAFDLTVNPLTHHWRQGKMPEPHTITKMRERVDYRDVILQGHRVKLARKEMGIDLGGIVKGYAADLAKNMLIQSGIHNALINLGGTIVNVGANPEIAVKNPFDNQSVAVVVVGIPDEIIVTSGIYEKYFFQDGKLFHHIINPISGFPSENGLVSVTLFGKNGAELDSLATACIVQGIEESLKMLEIKGIGALFFLSDGQMFANTEIRNRIKEELQ